MKRVMQLVFILITCTIVSSCASEDEQKERHYLKALEYIKQDNNKAAIIELRNAVQIDATYADARYQLGLLYLEEGDAKNAFAELVRTADLDPDNLDASIKTAQFYLLSRKTEESRKLVERILSKDPNHHDSLSLLARLELIDGNFEAAHAALDQLGEEVESSISLLSTRGRIFAAEEKWGDAEAAFRKTIKIEPDNIKSYRHLLLLYQSQSRTEEALALAKDMNDKMPGNLEALLLLAGIYRSQGELEKVEETLNKVIGIAPEQEQYRIMLADHYLNAGNTDEAQNVLIDAQQKLESSTDVDIMLATLYFEHQEFEQAQPLLNKVVAEQPDNKAARLLQARFLMSEGQLRESTEPLKQLNEDFPKWADPYFYLGLAHLGLGEPELAALEVSRAIEKNPSNYRYHTVMAQILLAQGDFENAKKSATISLNLNPKNLPAGVIFGRSLIGTKEFDYALKVYEDLNNQIPDNPDILYSLAIAKLRTQKHAEAIELLNQIIAIAPDHVRAIALLLRLTSTNDLDKAATFVRGQLEKAPESSKLYVLLGKILVRQNKTNEAVTSFETALQKDPTNSQASVAAGQLLVRLGERDEALTIYENMLAQNGESIVARMGIAALKLAGNDSAGAKDLYREILTLKDNYAPAANDLAWLIAESPDGDLGEALRLAMLAKQALPEDPNVSDTLGWVHYKRNAHSLAIPQFEMALVIRPDDPTIAYHLALALHGDNQMEKAKQTLEALLIPAADFPDRDQAETLLQELSAN